MAHELEIAPDGTASFYSWRQKAWHILGTVTEEAHTIEEAMQIARLAGWNVRKLEDPVTASIVTADGVRIVDIPGRYPIVRDNPFTKLPEGLAVVGEQYTVVQNEELAEFLEALVDESGAVCETMGSIFGGRKVFMAIRLKDNILIGGQDAHERYLVVMSSHDGSMAVTVIVTLIRVVCANTFKFALDGAKTKYVNRHTSGVGSAVQAAREALTLSFAYDKAFEKEMERLLLLPFEANTFGQMVELLLPVKPLKQTPRQQKAIYAAQETMWDIWNSPTLDFGRGTAYGALNAFTEYDQWLRPVRAKKELKDEARALRTLETDGQLSQRAVAFLTT